MKPTALATRAVELGVLLLLMATAVSSAQNTIEDTAQEAMADFITAWIHSGDAEKAQSYFSESIQSALLAPDRVWAEDTRDRSTLPARYWDFINNVWEPEAYWRTGRDRPAIMTAVGTPLVEAFRDELSVNVISNAQDTFLAFESLWGTESSPIDRDLPRLTAGERALYDDLRDNRIGTHLRLEQERIGFAWVRNKLSRLA